MSFETNEDLLREVMERQMDYSDNDFGFFQPIQNDAPIEVTNQKYQMEIPHFQSYEEMVQSDTYIKKEIRKMLAEHGIAKVNSLFHQVLQEDYEALQAILQPLKKEVKVKQEKVKEFVPVVPVTKPIEKVKDKPKKVKKEVKKVEEKKAEVMEDDFIDSLVAVPHRIANNTQVVVTKLKEGEEDNVPPNLTTKELREWQKDQEEKKHAELVRQGIDPTSLLTVENLKKWVEDEKKSYSYIARRLVGLPEAQVSAEAKKHGIVSEIAKRRLAVIAARKGK